MIAATIHDPVALSGMPNGSPTERAALIDHLAHVAHSHMIILDNEGRLGQSLLAVLPHLPMGIRARLEAAIRPDRVIRLPIDPQRLAKFSAVMDRSDTATALSISKNIDAIISDQDGKACADLADEEVGRTVYTLPEFCLSPCHQRLLETMGSVATGGMKVPEFERIILEPVVKWAKQVIIYDKYIAKAYYETDPNMFGSDSQWGRMCKTLILVRDLWKAKCAVDQDRFRVITSPIDRWGPFKRRGEVKCQWQKGQMPTYKEQATEIAQALGSDDKTQVDIVSIPKSLKYADHDRYLLTDRSVILSLSRGFDLIRPDGTLIESSLSLFHEGAKSSISELLRRMSVLATGKAGG